MLLSFSLFLFSIDRSVPLTIGSALVFGMSNGCMNNMSGVVHAYLFGRRHLGKISGVGYSSLIIGSALGPLPLGLIESGNIKQMTAVLRIGALLPIVMALFVMACPMKPLVPRDKPVSKENVELQHLLEE